MPLPPRPSPGRFAALRLRCPACGQGRLFSGWFAMHPRCSECGLDFRREPGFYLGSIYLNYGATALATGAVYCLLTLVGHWSPETALTVCLALAVALPVVLFRYARSFLLAIDAQINRGQSAPNSLEESAPGRLSAEHLSALRTDDGKAGCALGVALVLILLFGIAMAVATLFFTGAFDAAAEVQSDDGSQREVAR